jgi:hypothetical protein
MPGSSGRSPDERLTVSGTSLAGVASKETPMNRRVAILGLMLTSACGVGATDKASDVASTGRADTSELARATQLLGRTHVEGNLTFALFGHPKGSRGVCGATIRRVFDQTNPLLQVTARVGKDPVVSFTISDGKKLEVNATQPNKYSVLDLMTRGELHVGFAAGETGASNIRTVNLLAKSRGRAAECEGFKLLAEINDLLGGVMARNAVDKYNADNTKDLKDGQYLGDCDAVGPDAIRCGFDATQPGAPHDIPVTLVATFEVNQNGGINPTPTTVEFSRVH